MKNRLISIFSLIADTEEAEATAEVLPTNDSHSSVSPAPSPNSESNAQIRTESQSPKAQPPHIKSVEKINSTRLRSQEVDVEHNIPATFIPDTNNLNADR